MSVNEPKLDNVSATNVADVTPVVRALTTLISDTDAPLPIDIDAVLSTAVNTSTLEIKVAKSDAVMDVSAIAAVIESVEAT